MKTFMITLILVGAIIAGNSNVRLLPQADKFNPVVSDTTPTGKQPKQSAKKEELVKADKATLAAGLELIGNSDCTVCHKIEEKSIGPAYKDVAAKYKPTRAIIDTLVKKILEGGQGVWGQVPMTPHPALSSTDAQKMVQYILTIK